MGLLKKIFGKSKPEQKKNEPNKNEFPWLNGNKKTLTLDEVTDIEELLED